MKDGDAFNQMVGEIKSQIVRILTHLLPLLFELRMEYKKLRMIDAFSLRKGNYRNRDAM